MRNYLARASRSGKTASSSSAWQSGLGLVYDKKNLTLIREFGYLTEGWGITSDGKSLIMSDGTNMLHYP